MPACQALLKAFTVLLITLTEMEVSSHYGLDSLASFFSHIPFNCTHTHYSVLQRIAAIDTVHVIGIGWTSIRLSVRHMLVLSKWLNLLSNCLHCLVAHDSIFLRTKLFP